MATKSGSSSRLYVGRLAVEGGGAGEGDEPGSVKAEEESRKSCVMAGIVSQRMRDTPIRCSLTDTDRRERQRGSQPGQEGALHQYISVRVLARSMQGCTSFCPEITSDSCFFANREMQPNYRQMVSCDTPYVVQV